MHTMTTNWVLAQDYEGFPLMHHWRVLPHPGQSLPEELADVEKAVTYWGGGSQMRSRIEAVRDSSASIALFLEYIPRTCTTGWAPRPKPVTRRPRGPAPWSKGNCRRGPRS